MSATCDGCSSLTEHRKWWSNEIGNLSMILSLAQEKRNWEHVGRVEERLKELRDRIGR